MGSILFNNSNVVIASKDGWSISYSTTTSAFVIQTNDQASIKLYWAALYEGAYTPETLPPYSPKGYEAELDACHKHYYRFDDAFSFISSGFIASAGGYAYTMLHVPYFQSKSTVPSVTGKVHIGTSESITDTSPTATTFSADKATDGLIRLVATLDTANAALGGKPCVITLRSGDYLEISSEL